MKILIIGGTGGLGSVLFELLCKNHLVRITGSKELNVRDLDEQHIIIDYYPDVVINCAGINQDSMVHKAGDYSYAMTEVIETNVTGAVNVAAAFLPGMRERGYGRLIYISSVLSTKTVLGTGIYSASKAFVDKLVQNISAENASKGVTCNSIQLGYFDAGMTHRLKDADKIRETIPTKRWGRISELANVIEMIIETEYLTGANIKLDGGL